MGIDRTLSRVDRVPDIKQKAVLADWLGTLLSISGCGLVQISMVITPSIFIGTVVTIRKAQITDKLRIFEE